MTDPQRPNADDQSQSPSAHHSQPASVNQSEPSTQSVRKGRRGTRLTDISLSRSMGQKIPIEFDRYWKPIGPNASRYRSFVGLLARNKPSILIEEWRNVDEKVKQHIWDTIQVYNSLLHVMIIKYVTNLSLTPSMHDYSSPTTFLRVRSCTTRQ